ncbi:LuxR family transcriptional regulator [Elstera litoralis]|uniref:LuxR family transcriptional regulator n=1 Tax=Elstera litoralis TaxID=552518 RepID=A0A0F3IV37_9PROT|nr:response regulator transcription factor [Elstera litoralis]KJV10502.1 LuxR family transcriptional regulator [Elstera litoralis]
MTARLLCIEDDPDTRALLVEELEEAGYDVRAAADGADGLTEALSFRPDLILCDVMLPRLSGFDLLEKYGALVPNVPPFIFLTALTDRDNVLRGRRLGADDYVTKPIDFDILIEIVKRRLSRAAPAAATPGSHELTDREIETLTWVARGKSSSEIAEMLGISERTVNFHVENVMRKLDVVSRVQAAVVAVQSGWIRP